MRSNPKLDLIFIFKIQKLLLPLHCTLTPITMSITNRQEYNRNILEYLTGNKETEQIFKKFPSLLPYLIKQIEIFKDGRFGQIVSNWIFYDKDYTPAEMDVIRKTWFDTVDNTKIFNEESWVTYMRLTGQTGQANTKTNPAIPDVVIARVNTLGGNTFFPEHYISHSVDNDNTQFLTIQIKPLLNVKEVFSTKHPEFSILTFDKKTGVLVTEETFAIELPIIYQNTKDGISATARIISHKVHQYT